MRFSTIELNRKNKRIKWLIFDQVKISELCQREVERRKNELILKTCYCILSENAFFKTWKRSSVLYEPIYLPC
jgi:hypothetical protein